MKKETLHRAMNEVDEELLSRCNNVRVAAGAPAKTVRHPVYSFMKGAACFLLCGALLVGLMLLPKKKKDITDGAGYAGSDTKAFFAEDAKEEPPVESDGVSTVTGSDLPVPAGDAEGLWETGVDSFRVFRFGMFEEVPGGTVTYIRSFEELLEHYGWSLEDERNADILKYIYADYADESYFAGGGVLVLAECYTESGSFVMQPGSAGIDSDGVLHIGLNKYMGEDGTVSTADIGYYTAVIALSAPITGTEISVKPCNENASHLLRTVTADVLTGLSGYSEPAGYGADSEDNGTLRLVQEVLQAICPLPYDGSGEDINGGSMVMKLSFMGGDYCLYEVGGEYIAFEDPALAGEGPEKYSLSERDAALLERVLWQVLRNGSGNGAEDETTAAVSVDEPKPGTEETTVSIPDGETDAFFTVFRSPVPSEKNSAAPDCHIFRSYEELKMYVIAAVGGEEIFYEAYVDWYDENIAPCESVLPDGAAVVLSELFAESGSYVLKPGELHLNGNHLHLVVDKYVGLPDTPATCDVAYWMGVAIVYGEVSDCTVGVNVIEENG